MITLEIMIVFAILAFAILLFITEKVRLDVVALLVLAILALTGLVTPEEALSGFSNPAVVTVWAVLILSAGLARTGVAGLVGQRMLQLAGKSEARLLVIIMLSAGIMSGFMNSIGVTSLFLPVVIDLARRTRRPVSKLLIPLAFASLMGGLTTLIGTPTNILISESLKDAGLPPFQMFDYTPVGIAVLLAGTLYMVLIGRHLLPERDITREFQEAKSSDFESMYELHERMLILHLPSDSILHGKTLAQSRLGAILGLNVIAVFRNQQTLLAPDPRFQLKSGDRLLVEGRTERLSELIDCDPMQLLEGGVGVERLASSHIDLVEGRFPSRSPLVGKTLLQTRFRHRFEVIVLAIRRGQIVLRTNLETIPLLQDDVLLLQGESDQLQALKEGNELQLSRPESLEAYQLEERLMLVSIPDNSPLLGKTLVESHLGDSFGLGVMGIIREGETYLMPDPAEQLMSDDILLLKGRRGDVDVVSGLRSLEVERQLPEHLNELESEEIGLVEAVLSPHTTLAGKTLRELSFRTRYGLSVLAIWREGRAHRSGLRDMALRFGDALLLHGPRQRLRLMGSEPDFLVLSQEAQEAPRLSKAPLALLVMVLVLLPVILGWVPIAISSVAGVVLMILTGCLRADEAYRAIEWKAIFLIAGMLPLGIAMQKTGAANLLADGMISLIGGFGPLVVTGGLFVLAALVSQFMPNPAVAVLLAPIALSAANELGISAFPLMMGVAVAATSAFLSPVGHAANVLVMGPGGYRFSDYLKVGLPLTLIVLVVVLLLLPLFWPF
jgi:di/tricarboxylate transporter